MCDDKFGTGSCTVLIHAFLSQERRLPFMHSVVVRCRVPQECWTHVQTIADLRGTQRRKKVKRLPWSLQLCIFFVFGWFPVLLEWNANSKCSSSLCPLLWAHSSEPGMWILNPHDLTFFICETLGMGLALLASQLPYVQHGEIRLYVLYIYKYLGQCLCT